MKALVKNTAVISVTELALIIVAIIRNKYLAVNIGPEGFGVYGLLQSFFSLVSILAGGWLASGATKFTSEYSQKKDSVTVQKVASLSMLITAVLSVLIIVVLVAGQDLIRRLFLSEKVLSIYFLFFSVSFLGSSLNPVFVAVLQGLKQIKSVVIFRILVSLADIVFVLVFVGAFALIGFFASIFATSVITLVVIWVQFKRSLGSWSLPAIDESIVKGLLYFGLSGIFLGLLYLGGQYFLRILILKNLDLSALGLFQAAMGIVGYLGIMNRGIFFSYFPDISEAMSGSNRNAIINEYLRFVLTTNIPITVFAILFGEQMLRILFSAKFLPLSEIFFWFALVHFFSSVSTLFHTNLMGMGLVKNFTYFSIFGTLLLLIPPAIFMGKYGLVTIAFGFLLSYAGTIPGYFWYLHKKTQFNFSAKVYRILVSGVVLISFSIACAKTLLIVRVFYAILTLLAVGFMLEKEEYKKFFAAIEQRLSSL